jgi:GR25 family glycosyltransferase involved in LPS biosynthesis
MSQYFEKIYVVNLQEDTKKFIFFQEQINKTIFKDKYQKFLAVSGKEINIDDIDSSIITDNGRKSIISKTQKVFGVSLTYGSLGCALSHKKIWEECSLSTKPFLVFEDDIIPHKNFNQIFLSLQEKIKSIDYDICYIGYNEIPGFRKQEMDSVLSKPSGLITGTYGYFVTPSGAKNLLSIFPLNKQIDSSISANLHKIQAYCSTVKLVCASAKFGSKTQRKNSCVNNIQKTKDHDDWNKLFS